MSRCEIVFRRLFPLSYNPRKRIASFWDHDSKTIAHVLRKPQVLGDAKRRLTEFFASKSLNRLLPIRGIELGKFSASTSSDVKCWNCQQYLQRKKFCCSLCGALQYPTENMNYFELLGVTQTFDMNQQDLSTKFKDLQMIFHPDKFANKSKTEVEISEIYSRLLNKAYVTLKEPLKRGLYLLELRKLPAEDNFPLEQEFLTSIMEKNETLESITSKNALDKFMRNNIEEINEQINLISKSFSTSNWKEARINLLKLNYLLNLNQKVKGKQTSLTSMKNQ